jgi:2-oxoglutarate dehydrogenase E2 component (dihydrolipoamide succinyltransferase)
VYEIRIPKLGLDTIECDIRRWIPSVGDSVSKGSPLIEVETEKAVMTIESEVAGVLREVRAQPGQTVAVGAIVGVIED